MHPADLGPHQLTEKPQALVAQEQRPRILLVLAGRVRVPLRAVPNARYGYPPAPGADGPDQGDIALQDVRTSRCGSDSMDSLSILRVYISRHPSTVEVSLYYTLPQIMTHTAGPHVVPRAPQRAHQAHSLVASTV